MLHTSDKILNDGYRMEVDMNTLFLWTVGYLIIFVSLTHAATKNVAFTDPITCSFQFGQYMDSQESKSNTQKSALEWNFFELLSPKAYFLAGGDTGSVIVHRHETSNGVSIWLKQGNGAHLFSIWPDGTAFWSKHNDVFGSKATQQFRGSCSNVRKTD
jgi:hypothetical protein